MEFLRAIGPVFNFLLLALALIFFTRKQIRKLFQERRDRIADALGRAADAQDQARHTAEDIAEAQQAADAEARAQLAEAKAQAEANTAAADAETAREAETVRRERLRRGRDALRLRPRGLQGLVHSGLPPPRLHDRGGQRRKSPAAQSVSGHLVG